MATAKTTAATKSFKELNDKLPYNPQTQNGKGFLPPFLRALSHLLYGLGRVSDSKDADKFVFLKPEIKDAIEHLNNVEVDTKVFSKAAQESLVILKQSLEAYEREYEPWTEDEKLSNMKSLVNKVMSIASMLDREFLGIRNSDPGSAL